MGLARESAHLDKEQETTKAEPEEFSIDQKMGLIGPDVDDDIRRAITRYGADAVRKAARRLTTRKRGRPLGNDWAFLRDVLTEDAKDWLAGGDPFNTRSNYSIAKDFAERNPGHNSPSTVRRIQRKLTEKPYDRIFRTLIYAENISEENYPHGDHIRALVELIKINDHSAWKLALKNVKSEIADYEAVVGELPPEHFSIKQVTNAAHNAHLELVRPPKNTLRGLFSSYVEAQEPKR